VTASSDEPIRASHLALSVLMSHRMTCRGESVEKRMVRNVLKAVLLAGKIASTRSSRAQRSQRPDANTPRSSSPHRRHDGSGAPAHGPHIALPLASLAVRMRSLAQRGHGPPKKRAYL